MTIFPSLDNICISNEKEMKDDTQRYIKQTFIILSFLYKKHTRVYISRYLINKTK